MPELQNLLIPLLIVLFAIPLVLQARKQKRTMQEQQKLQNSIQTGDRVMTTSGLFGTVVDTDDDNIELEVSPGVTTTWLRQAIREKVNTESESVEDSGDADDDSEDVAEETAETTQTEQVEQVEEVTSSATSSASEAGDKAEETGDKATSTSGASSEKNS